MIHWCLFFCMLWRTDLPFFPNDYAVVSIPFLYQFIPAAAIFNTLDSMVNFCRYLDIFWTSYSISLIWIFMHQYFSILLMITLITVDYLNLFIESPYSPSSVNPQKFLFIVYWLWLCFFFQIYFSINLITSRLKAWWYVCWESPMYKLT